MQKVMNSYIPRLGFEFEQLCAEIFEYKGIKVEKNVTLRDSANYVEIDLILTNKNGKRSAVEIKFYLTRKPSKNMLEKAIRQIKGTSQIFNIENQVLIIGLPINNKLKTDLSKEHSVHILDGKNILYLIENNDFLLRKFNDLMQDIPNDVQDEIEAEPFDLNILFNDNSNITYVEAPTIITKGESLWRELKAIDSGLSSFNQYENKCEEILKYLFDENLNGWNRQLRTDDDLNRYDLICRVKRGNEFWKFLVDEFHSRYIVFEFKNYSEEVKQTQVYTTEKYLFQKALRNVCFLISRKGLSENAITATKGILRESGKLILNICDNDLYKLLQLKESGDEPSDFLFELVDDTLLKLSK
ncbi:restriction endonuclease [Lysinibacillus fusiformis]|uniref:restriction endonuclease n=1 Tax=Lysinibacillus fusiformis TaxID=28031 RepID=UPI0000F38F47|nr:restriction endonuclease [Lysinibacillus fusiformis]EAZ84558.1 hypothetical protein BB14905_21443 [Bacillus sp. B14905]MED4076331.1 restriction endonuclease [Lysinibacillus fusiformis]